MNWKGECEKDHTVRQAKGMAHKRVPNAVDHHRLVCVLLFLLPLSLINFKRAVALSFST
jgi:hypothetical protein